MSRIISHKLINACMHKTARNDGMDAGQMRIALTELYPDRDFSRKSRKDLETFCNQEEDLINAVKNKKYRYFKTVTELNEIEQEYCKCIAHGSNNCVGEVNCTKEYDLRQMPIDEIDNVIL